MHHLAASVVPLAAGTAYTVFVVSYWRWGLLALPVAWLLTTHGMRKLRTVIFHQCSHGNFLRNKRVDSLLGQAIAIFLVSQEYQEYKGEHIADHHATGHMTPEDPTVKFIILSLRLRPGLGVRRMWRRVLRCACSPTFQAKSTCGRFISHFRGTSKAYRILLVTVLISQVALVTLTGSWLAYVVAWLFPLTILFNIAAILRLSSRHIFPVAGQRLSGRAAIGGYTHGIFIGERAPEQDPWSWAWAAQWTRWWLRLLFVHLPSRLMVLVGDGPCHDFHHRYPKSKDWANYMFARQQDVDSGHPGWPDYTEVWGLKNAIDAVFMSLDKADPAIFDATAMAFATPAESLAVFEE